MRPQFEDAGARLVVITADPSGAQAFKDSVWKGGDIYIDEDEGTKRALGGKEYKNWWLLRPSVLLNIVAYVRKFGTFTGDAQSPKAQMLGGTVVIKDGEVVHVHRETSNFYNGDAKVLLNAVMGRTLTEGVSPTPYTSSLVCDRK